MVEIYLRRVNGDIVHVLCRQREVNVNVVLFPKSLFHLQTAGGGCGEGEGP